MRASLVYLRRSYLLAILPSGCSFVLSCRFVFFPLFIVCFYILSFGTVARVPFISSMMEGSEDGSLRSDRSSISSRDDSSDLVTLQGLSNLPAEEQGFFLYCKAHLSKKETTSKMQLRPCMESQLVEIFRQLGDFTKTLSVKIDGGFYPKLEGEKGVLEVLRVVETSRSFRMGLDHLKCCCWVQMGLYTKFEVVNVNVPVLFGDPDTDEAFPLVDGDSSRIMELYYTVLGGFVICYFFFLFVLRIPFLLPIRFWRFFSFFSSAEGLDARDYATEEKFYRHLSLEGLVQFMHCVGRDAKNSAWCFEDVFFLHFLNMKKMNGASGSDCTVNASTTQGERFEWGCSADGSTEWAFIFLAAMCTFDFSNFNESENFVVGKFLEAMKEGFVHKEVLSAMLFGLSDDPVSERREILRVLLLEFIPFPFSQMPILACAAFRWSRKFSVSCIVP